MPNFSYTDSMYIQIDFCGIKHVMFILTYSGSFICESQFYYIRLVPVVPSMSEFSDPMTSLLIVMMIMMMQSLKWNWNWK